MKYIAIHYALNYMYLLYICYHLKFQLAQIYELACTTQCIMYCRIHCSDYFSSLGIACIIWELLNCCFIVFLTKFLSMI